MSIVSRLTGGYKYIVRDLSFKINSGECLAIVGESGSGKTMTALAVFSLLPENCTAQGEIVYQNKNLLHLTEKEMSRLRGTDFVLMPQSGADFLNPSLKIGYQFFESLKKLGLKGNALKETAVELLRNVGFSEPDSILKKYPFQLSGGMAQRIVLAIGMAAKPKLVIADEPTRGIDDDTSNFFLNYLYSTFKEAAIVLITHNISVASRCDNILVMFGGELMEYGKSNIVLNSPSHPYTRSLIDALPENNFHMSTENWDKSIEINEGCSFAPRCSQAMNKCFTEKPPIKQEGDLIMRCFVC